MSLSSQSSPFSAILTNLVSRVSAALNISTDYIRPVASDDYVVTETENLFAYLRPFTPSPVDATTGKSLGDYGAGRLARPIGRRIRVYIYTRSGVDVVGGDEVALSGTDPNQTVETPPSTPGQLIAEEILLNALDDYDPLNDSGVSMTIGPVHWIPSEGGPPMRKPEDEEGLVRSALDFQVIYVLAQQNVEPAPTTLPTPVQVP